MHIRPEEFCVFFDEDEYFAAFTTHLQEIDLSDLVFRNKILEGDRLDFNRFPIRIIIWSIRVGFYNFSATSFSLFLPICRNVFPLLSEMAY